MSAAEEVASAWRDDRSGLLVALQEAQIAIEDAIDRMEGTNPFSALQPLLGVVGREEEFEEKWRAAHAPTWAAVTEASALRLALQDLYDFLPRWSCKSVEPDGCAVCRARELLRSTS